MDKGRVSKVSGVQLKHLNNCNQLKQLLSDIIEKFFDAEPNEAAAVMLKNLK